MTDSKPILTAIIFALALVAMIATRCGGSGSDRGDGAGECSPRLSGYDRETGKWKCG